MTLFGKLADQEDGKLISRNLIGVCVPASFIEQRGKVGEEVK